MRKRCVQDGPKGKGMGYSRGQGSGPLGVPAEEELIMGKSDKAVELVDSIFNEGFEDYSRIKAAERHIDLLLDMCGVPHHKKKVKEDMDPVTSTMYATGRPYDAPRKMRIKPVVDVNIDADEIETDMSECDGIQGEKYPGDFEGASPSGLPEEEPAKEMTPQKKQNKINTVPNQNAAGLLAAIKGEMMKEELMEMGVGSKAASQLVKKAKAIIAKRRMLGKPAISMKQAARMATM